MLKPTIVRIRAAVLIVLIDRKRWAARPRNHRRCGIAVDFDSHTLPPISFVFQSVEITSLCQSVHLYGSRLLR